MTVTRMPERSAHVLVKFRHDCGRCGQDSRAKDFPAVCPAYTFMDERK